MNEDMIDTKTAAAELGVTPNNLRQMVFKKKINKAGHEGRKAMFYRNDVEALKSLRIKDNLRTTESPIAVSQSDHPLDD